jgi:hypothetical protein
MSHNRILEHAVTDYLVRVREIATSSRSQIEEDLAAARIGLDRAQAELDDANARVRSLQTLLDLASSQPESHEPEPARLTLHEAMAEVLRSAPDHKLRAGDLAAEIQRRRLYQMRDGRPVEPQQIHARVGHYGHLFAKDGTFIKLRA